MDDKRYKALQAAWREAACHGRRTSSQVHIGPVTIGGTNPVAVQSMTDCNTNDIDACLRQIGRIRRAGGHIVRLTVQGMREAASIASVTEQSHAMWPDTAIVADIHFVPQVADAVADKVDKVRINPGNYNDRGGNFEALVEKCRANGTALRIGVNHGSLSPAMVTRYGDTPEGMVESAMEFLRVCRSKGFEQIVISMKSSNTRVMVHAYRMLVAAMALEGMEYPVHLGVTEAGNGIEGRIKSAVGIGAMLADGTGDTLRVSLTEPPQNEIPVASALVSHFARRGATAQPAIYDPFSYSRRQSVPIGRVGGGNTPLLRSEFSSMETEAAETGKIAVLSATGPNPVSEWREAIAAMERNGDRRPVILRRSYDTAEASQLALMAAADFGVMFIDGLADGMELVCDGVEPDILEAISLDILQASRARMSKTEFISCPGCGRTLYDLQDTLATIKGRMSHLKGLKIGVMGCIVNGPGEMADADYGYVGAGPGRISLYRGREAVRRNMPQEEALDALIELIKADGRWEEEA